MKYSFGLFRFELSLTKFFSKSFNFYDIYHLAWDYPIMSYSSFSFIAITSFRLFPRYVVLISGLGIGAADHNPLALQMFVDLITGQLGSSDVS